MELKDAISRLRLDADNIKGDSPEVLEIVATVRMVCDAAESTFELRQELEDEDDLRTRMGNLLTGVADALYGEPDALGRHDWSQLPKNAALMRKTLDDLQPYLLHREDCPASCVARENEELDDDGCECGLSETFNRPGAFRLLMAI